MAVSIARDSTVSEGARVALRDALRSCHAYYPEWCELRLLDEHLPAIAHEAGANARLIEIGDGGIKTKRLHRALAAARPCDPPRTLVFCPHSPLDGYSPSEAVRWLASVAILAGECAQLVLAADGTRDRARVLAAYGEVCSARWDEARARVELRTGDGIAYAYKHSVLAMRGMLVAGGWEVAAVHAWPGHDVRLWRCVRHSI